MSFFYSSDIEELKNIILTFKWAMRIYLLLFLFSFNLYPQSVQQFAELGDFELENGEVILNCKIGYRTFGTLNSDSSNALLFPTWFGGTSEHLTSLIGENKLVDSTKYFVITVDALGDGVSSSPSNSETQAGENFPVFTISDMVHSQYVLLTKYLGIDHLYGIIGGSMGGMQVFQWIISYPDFIDKAVSYVGSPRLTSEGLLLWNTELSIINLSHQCNNENDLLKAVAGFQTFAITTPDYRVRNTSYEQFDDFINGIYKTYSKLFNPYDYASQLKAMINHNVAKKFGNSLEDAAKIVKTNLFVIVGAHDHMVNPAPALEFAGYLNSETYIFNNDCGHLAPGCEMEKFVEIVNKFLKGEKNE